MEPLLVSCTSPEDYWNWIFQLQQVRKRPVTTTIQPSLSCVHKLGDTQKEKENLTCQIRFKELFTQVLPSVKVVTATAPSRFPPGTLSSE